MSEIAHDKQREKEVQRQKYGLPEKSCHFHGTTCTSHRTQHITSPHFALVNCQAYGLGPRNQPHCQQGQEWILQVIFPPPQVNPAYPLHNLPHISLVQVFRWGPEGSKYQSVMMHRTKHTLPHSLFQLFSLQVPLKTKSRKHLQSAAGRKNAHRGQICRAKRCHFSLHLCQRHKEDKSGETQWKEGNDKNSEGKKYIF